jgi:hypothetical protein
MNRAEQLALKRLRARDYLGRPLVRVVLSRPLAGAIRRPMAARGRR